MTTSEWCQKSERDVTFSACLQRQSTPAVPLTNASLRRFCASEDDMQTSTTALSLEQGKPNYRLGTSLGHGGIHGWVRPTAALESAAVRPL